ncbi:LAQU0S16e01420g1_1 [Lachancea quebecensis]|uniref:Pre-mRNA-splicing factor CWC21 n=1 Tax=Lachancea quebecensis TaxID=1654605 RepID=A0A0P1KYH3_9SACH|nr:LAQU0S16e01420g1_1 [Lachancea quebecensis]
MSYDGIGLKSAKGSSTSGHIQQSLALNTERKNVKNFLSRVEKQQKRPKPNAQSKHKDESILKHLNKREVELRVSEYRDTLEEDDSLSDASIDAKCEEYRKKVALQLQKERDDEKLRNAYVSRSKRQAESGATDQ